MEAATRVLEGMERHVSHPEWGMLHVRSVECIDGIIMVDYAPAKADDYAIAILRRFLRTGVYYPGVVDHLYVEMIDVEGNINFYKAYSLFRGVVVAAEESVLEKSEMPTAEISAVKFRIKDFLGMRTSSLEVA